jgi:hypothetical protein
VRRPLLLGEVEATDAALEITKRLTLDFWFDFCSKFFGAKGAAPQQQTKLSFATKTKTKTKVAEDEDERDTEDDASAKENTDPDQGTQ